MVIQDFITKVMLGHHVLGNACGIDVDKGTWALVQITSGQIDLELQCMSYYRIHGYTGKEDVTEEMLNDPLVQQHFQRLKNYFRQQVANIFTAAEREERQQMEQELAATRKKVLQELAQSNKPHEMGTVAEIAARYNISKSEVRRRKVEGTLHELK